jgi:hypothetical protein
VVNTGHSAEEVGHCVEELNVTLWVVFEGRCGTKGLMVVDTF